MYLIYRHLWAALLALALVITAVVSNAVAETSLPDPDADFGIVSEGIELDAPELEEFLLEGLDEGADRVLEDGSGDEHAVSASTGTAINAKTFPDSVFRDYVSANFDTNGDGILSADECAAVTEITVYRKAIASLKGIEYFQNLDFLGCSSCQLTALDVSRLSKLTDLRCDQNQLKKLDVRSNPKLKVLHCRRNQLKALNVSKNPELEYLLVTGNSLTKLNVKSNTALKGLACDSNQLTKLDVSRNTKLDYLNCGYNQLTRLDLSHNPALKELWCDSNRLDKLNLRKNRKLEVLNCSSNLIYWYIYGLDREQHSSLDISKCTALRELRCEGCGLGSLDLSKHTALETLICPNCDLTYLNVSGCRALKECVCSDNRALGFVNLGKNPALEYLECYATDVSLLNISKCTKLLAAYKKGTAKKVVSSGRSYISYGYGDYTLDVDPAIMIDTRPKPDIYLIISESLEVKAKAGKSIQIVVKGKKIKSCKSYNKKVAKVTAADRFTTKAAGKAKIKVTLTNGKKLTLTLTVRKP